MSKEKVSIDKEIQEPALTPEGVKAQNFLAKYYTADMFALVTAQGQDFIIQQARKLAETLQEAGMCATQDRAKGAAERQGRNSTELIKFMQEEIIPLASGIIDTGAGSWSQGVSQKMADGSTLTLTLRAINPQYIAGEESKKLGTVERELEKYMKDNWNELTLIAQCQKGIKSKVAPSVLPRVKGKTQKVTFPVEGKFHTLPSLDKKGEFVLGKDGMPLTVQEQSVLQFDLILGISE